jgi:hypothetical protein
MPQNMISKIIQSSVQWTQPPPDPATKVSGKELTQKIDKYRIPKEAQHDKIVNGNQKIKSWHFFKLLFKGIFRQNNDKNIKIIVCTENHRNSRTGPQIAAYIFDRVTVFKNVSATSKYLLVLSECMDSKNILSIEPNLPLLKLVKFYGIIKKTRSDIRHLSQRFRHEFFPFGYNRLLFFQNFVPVIFVNYRVSSGYNVNGLLFTRVDIYRRHYNGRIRVLIC